MEGQDIEEVNRQNNPGSFAIKLKRQGMTTETKARKKNLSTDFAD